MSARRFSRALRPPANRPVGGDLGARTPAPGVGPASSGPGGVHGDRRPRRAFSNVVKRPSGHARRRSRPRRADRPTCHERQRARSPSGRSAGGMERARGRSRYVVPSVQTSRTPSPRHSPPSLFSPVMPQPDHRRRRPERRICLGCDGVDEGPGRGLSFPAQRAQRACRPGTGRGTASTPSAVVDADGPLSHQRSTRPRPPCGDQRRRRSR